MGRDMSKEKKENIIRVLHFFIVPGIYLVLMILVQNYLVKQWPVLHHKPLIFTYTLFVYIQLILIALTGNLKRSTIIMSISLWILELINILRYKYTHEPITFGDFVFASNIGQITSIVKDDIFKRLWSMASVFLGFGVLLSFLTYGTHKFNFKPKKAFRISTGIVSFVILFFIFFPSKWMRSFALNTIYDRDKSKDYWHNSTNMMFYTQEGLIGGMYVNLQESRIFEPDSYEPEKLAKVLKEYEESEPEGVWEKSNIIVTFSESFFDVSLLEEDVKFNKPVTENYNRLKDEGIFVDMITPTYGGVSCNVEFEFLTGYSLNYFGKGYTPFMSLYNRDKYKDRPSLLKELKNNGYFTKVVFGKDFFKSEKVYERLGVEEYEEKDDKEHYRGYYTSDEYLIDEAIEALENKSQDEKLFYMNCTIESHMPFVEKKYDNYDFDVESSTLNKEQTKVIKSYAQSCYNADQELGRLYDYIQTFDEPTIIVFFGDHLPYLSDPDTSDDLLASLKYFNTGDSKLDAYRKYNTGALILANFDLGNDMSLRFMSPDMLLTTIVNKMGLDLNSYYKWLYDTKGSLPSSNYLVSQMQNGDIEWTKSLNDEANDVNNLRELMQYYVLIDGKNN